MTQKNLVNAEEVKNVVNWDYVEAFAEAADFVGKVGKEAAEAADLAFALQLQQEEDDLAFARELQAQLDAEAYDADFALALQLQQEENWAFEIASELYSVKPELSGIYAEYYAFGY